MINLNDYYNSTDLKIFYLEGQLENSFICTN